MPLVTRVQSLLQFRHLRDRLLALRRDERDAERGERLAVHPEHPAGLDVGGAVAAAVGDDDAHPITVHERCGNYAGRVVPVHAAVMLVPEKIPPLCHFELAELAILAFAKCGDWKSGVEGKGWTVSFDLG